MRRATSSYPARSHLTALPGWRVESARPGAVQDCCLVLAAASGLKAPVRLLDALLELPDPPAEVVIADGRPDRELSRVLREWSDLHPAPFALVYAACPPGWTRQRNIGVDIGTLDFIFFLDEGVIPLPGYFSETRRVFDRDRNRCVGAVAGVVIDEMLPAQPASWRLRRYIGLAPRTEPLLYHPSGSHAPRSFLKAYSGLRRIDLVPGCAAAFRREVFAGARFSCFFRECADGADDELSLRIGDRWTLLFCGEALVRRASPLPAAPPSFFLGRHALRNRLFVWKRHTARPAKRHVVQFWVNALLTATAAFASFLTRPWRVGPLGYAAGVVTEMVWGLFRPPSSEEPPPRREYLLDAYPRGAAAVRAD
jgi:hypothetical protein